MNSRAITRRTQILVSIAITVLIIVIFFYLTRFESIENTFSTPDGLVELPPAQTSGEVSVEEAINLRRSVRSYTAEALSLQDVSQLMWAAQGITDPGRNLRAAPSAGATYPLELYLVVGTNGVTGLDEGLYYYDPYHHHLEFLLKNDLRSELATAALGQSCVGEAPLNIVITAVYERTTQRYGERGVRYVHMEAGHVGQNLYLQAVSRGLGLVVIGAFHDSQVSDLLHLPADQEPLYIISVGHVVR